MNHGPPDSSAARTVATHTGVGFVNRDTNALTARGNTAARENHQESQDAGELEQCLDEVSLRKSAEHVDEGTPGGIL